MKMKLTDDQWILIYAVIAVSITVALMVFAFELGRHFCIAGSA